MIDTSPSTIFQEYCPPQLIAALKKLEVFQMPLFLAGGAVRDILAGRIPGDLDFTLPHNALQVAQLFAQRAGGTFVLLDEAEEVARVVCCGFVLDFSSFREGTSTISDDLCRRDFTINAMALPFHFTEGRLGDITELIDPLGGASDLAKKIVRSTSEDVFRQDPLRSLRAYRFAACLGFALDAKTGDGIQKNSHLISQVSPERVSYELDLLIASHFAVPFFEAMAKTSLLFSIFPELEAGVGMKQPGSHHLDVFRHNIMALRFMEEIIQVPEIFFKDLGPEVVAYLKKPERQKWLKWAALFHDVAKSTTLRMRNGKITFYDHDNCGAEIFDCIAQRLKWSKQDRHQVSKLIRLHMWPFHLNNSLKKTGIKARASLKLYNAAAGDLTGLFVLAMADSLAASGPGKPVGMEDELLNLFSKIISVVDEKIKPVSTQPPVLTGCDLINELSLTPGPIFAEILQKLEEEQVINGKIAKAEALLWVRQYLEKSGCVAGRE